MRPTRMTGSGREAFPDVWEWSGGPPECLGVVRSPSRMSGSGLEALPDVRVFGMPSRMFESGREAVLDV